MRNYKPGPDTQAGLVGTALASSVASCLGGESPETRTLNKFEDMDPRRRSGAERPGPQWFCLIQTVPNGTPAGDSPSHF